MGLGSGQNKAIPLLDLHSQYGPIREEILAAVTRLIDSQRFILGEEVRELEQELASYCGARFAVGCASGSDALTLAQMTCGIQPGDQVIMTPYSFFATAGSSCQLQARPVFVDIDYDTFNIDVELIPEALERHDRVRAIIPVHLFGACADMDPILSLARERGWYVIEDAAQAIGAEYNGRRAGSMGDVNCFSFFPSKNLGGFGDGGLLTTDDPAKAEQLIALRVHGRTGKYVHEWIGLNSRLDALQAAVLRVKFRYLDGWTAQRQQNAELYNRLLGESRAPVVTPKTAPYQTRHVHNQYAVRCPDRDRLKVFLQRNGVGTEIYYPLPLHLQKCFDYLGYKEGDFPVSEQTAKEALSLPVAEVSTEEVEAICHLIRQFYS